MPLEWAQQHQYGFYWRQRQRDSKPKLELTYHTAADCYSIVATLQSVCTECECVRPGVNVCQGQVVVLAMDQLYLPGWCPPKPRPSYVPTSTNTIQRADYPRCVPCTMRASGPSGGVQLGVGELVSALAAPSPLIAGANTILAIYFHFPILTSSCSC